VPLAGIRYFPKWASSAFVNPELDPWLRANDVGTLALSGLQAKACVSATCKDALARGYAVELLPVAIACVSDGSRARALARSRGSAAWARGWSGSVSRPIANVVDCAHRRDHPVRVSQSRAISFGGDLRPR
jgi:hypothetical protein